MTERTVAENTLRMEKCARLAALDAKDTLKRVAEEEFCDGTLQDQSRIIGVQIVASMALYAAIAEATLKMGEKEPAILLLGAYAENVVPILEKLKALVEGD